MCDELAGVDADLRGWGVVGSDHELRKGMVGEVCDADGGQDLLEGGESDGVAPSIHAMPLDLLPELL